MAAPCVLGAPFDPPVAAPDLFQAQCSVQTLGKVSGGIQEMPQIIPWESQNEQSALLGSALLGFLAVTKSSSRQCKQQPRAHPKPAPS